MSFVHLSYLKTIVYQPEPILQIILKNCPSGWCYSTCQGQGITHFYGNLTKWFVHSSKFVFSNTILKFSAAAFCSELLSSLRNGSEWRVGFYFCSTERKSEFFSLLRKGSERNSESLPPFLFHGTELRVVISSAEGFGTEFRDFLFRGTPGIPSEITIGSVYSVFRGIIFLSEIPNPSRDVTYQSLPGRE